MTEAELIERMARAADPLAFVEGSPLADRDGAIEAQRRALSAMREAGFVPASPEATYEMQCAAIDTHPYELGDISPLGLRMSPQKMFAEVYLAMLAASPLNQKGEA